MSERKQYDEEFKTQAIKALETRGTKTVDEVCKELGVPNSMVYMWRAGRNGKVAKRNKAKEQVKEQKATSVIGTAFIFREVVVYLKHALSKWPPEKKREIHRLYVELALATLEGKT